MSRAEAQSLSGKRAQVEFHKFASLGDFERVIQDYAEENLRRRGILVKHRDFIGPLSRTPVRLAGDALHLPFRDGSIRMIAAFQMLHLFMDIESVFLEVKRVLAPAGGEPLPGASLRDLRSRAGLGGWTAAIPYGPPRVCWVGRWPRCAANPGFPRMCPPAGWTTLRPCSVARIATDPSRAPSGRVAQGGRRLRQSIPLARRPRLPRLAKPAGRAQTHRQLEHDPPAGPGLTSDFL